jgi:hypothetical protein
MLSMMRQFAPPRVRPRRPEPPNPQANLFGEFENRFDITEGDDE